MKTIQKISYAVILLAILGIIVTGCSKKKDDTGPTPTGTSNLQQLAKDDNNVENAYNEVTNDANAILSGGSGLKSTAVLFPCGVSVDSSQILNDSVTYYLTYNGLNCPGNLYRTGNVEIKRKLGEYWVMPGATVTIKLINFKVTHIASGISITYNGQSTFQNVTGGHIWMVGWELSQVIHKAWGTITATFEDNTTRTWHVARQRLFTGIQDSLVMAIDGFGSADGYNNLVVWGIDRAGNQFYSQINQSVIFKQSCNWDPCSGIQNYLIPSQNMSGTVTFGYNSNNEPTTGNECPTKYRLDWAINGNSGTFYLPLH